MNKEQILEAAKEAGAIINGNGLSGWEGRALFTEAQLLKFADLLLAKSVPDGYVPVPIEPTNEMSDAVFEIEHDWSDGYVTCKSDRAAIYKAMIAAAPKGVDK